MDGTTVCFYFPPPNVVANAIITFNKAFRCNRIKTSNQLLREVLGGSLFLLFPSIETKPAVYRGIAPFFFGDRKQILLWGDRSISVFLRFDRDGKTFLWDPIKNKKRTLARKKKFQKKSKHIVKHEQPAAFV